MVRRVIGLAALVVGVVVLAGPVRGQGADQHGPGVQPPVSFVFDGGTAAEYVARVQEASGVRRVVVMPGVERFVMPPVELREVGMASALMPLRYARLAGGGGKAELEVAFEGDVVVVSPMGDWGRAGKRLTEVFSLARILERGEVGAEDVLTAVETAMELGEREGIGAAMRYHPETRLLMVRGGGEAIESVERVLRGLIESSEVMQRGEEESVEVRRQAEQMRAALMAARKEVDEAERFAKEVEERARAGEAGPLDVLNAREEVIERERRLAEIEGRLRLLEGRMELEKERRERREMEERAHGAR